MHLPAGGTGCGRHDDALPSSQGVRPPPAAVARWQHFPDRSPRDDANIGRQYTTLVHDRAASAATQIRQNLSFLYPLAGLPIRSVVACRDTTPCHCPPPCHAMPCQATRQHWQLLAACQQLPVAACVPHWCPWQPCLAPGHLVRHHLAPSVYKYEWPPTACPCTSGHVCVQHTAPCNVVRSVGGVTAGQHLTEGNRDTQGMPRLAGGAPAARSASYRCNPPAGRHSMLSPAHTSVRRHAADRGTWPARRIRRRRAPSKPWLHRTYRNKAHISNSAYTPRSILLPTLVKNSEAATLHSCCAWPLPTLCHELSTPLAYKQSPARTSRALPALRLAAGRCSLLNYIIPNPGQGNITRCSEALPHHLLITERRS